MYYKILDRNDIEKLGEIDRSELVEHNYRCKDGKLELFSYYCDIKRFNEKQLEKHKENLYQLYDRGGTIFGAFDGPNLVGISSLDSKFRGLEKDMLQLVFLHVSKDYRKKGIGKKLIELAKDKATELGAKRLYISGSPIKNTIEFYMAIGCKPVNEVEKDLFELEPEDIHLELILKINTVKRKYNT